jgi:hypothetical protein
MQNCIDFQNKKNKPRCALDFIGIHVKACGNLVVGAIAPFEALSRLTARRKLDLCACSF